MSHNDGYPIIHGRATNGKIKAIQTDINGKIEISASDMEINTDGLETLATATNTKLDALISANHTDIVNTKDRIDALITANHTDLAHLSDNLDHLSSNLDTIHNDLNPLLNNIDSELEGHTVLLTTANTNTAHISDNLDHLSANLDTINNTLTGGGVVDTSALATHAKQDTINSSVGALNVPVSATATNTASTNTKLDSLISANHTDLEHLSDNLDHLSDNLDTLNTTQTNGNQLVKIMGSEDGATTGTQRQIHIDGSGNLQCNVVNSIFQIPANSANSHITDDPANALAVGLRARTTIGTATTEQFLHCNSEGALSTTDKKTYTALTTVDAALAVNATSNGDSSIVNNTDYNSVYQLQIVCSDAAYSSWTADIYQSIDASNFYKTFEDLNNGPSGPSSKLLTIIDRPASSWKINIQNTGASNKTFAIKYIKA